MTVRCSLYAEIDDRHVADLELAAVPAIGTEVMVLARDWEIYRVVGVRHWPRLPGDDLEERPDVAPKAVLYVRYGGDL
jgi:hypothetical protein